MSTKLKYTSIAIAGLAAGFTSGYVVAYIRAGKLLDKGLAEIEGQYKDALDRSQKTGAYATVDEAVATLISDEDLEDVEDSIFIAPDQDLLADYRDRIDEQGHVTFPGEGSEDGENEPDEEDSDEIEDEYDTAAEPTTPEFISVRDPNGPYIISIDDYMDSESPYEKLEMTYFEGDETLIDSGESIVPNIEGTVGTKNLDSWGKGTTDPNQVYIRNERLESDIELTRDENTYTRAVLGIIPADEIKRSMTKPLRMREGDGD